MTNTMPVQEPTREEILHAAALLAGQCDGARDRDDAGYNAVDSPTAKSILRFRKKSDRQIRTLWIILRKYKEQLSGLGVQYESLIPPPPPSSPGEGKTPMEVGKLLAPAAAPGAAIRLEKATLKDGLAVAIVFEYREDLVELAKSLPGRRYDKEGKIGGFAKSWLVPADPGSILRAIDVFKATNLPLQVAPELSLMVEQGKKTYEESRADSADLEVPTKLPPYSFQKAGIAWIDSRPNNRAMIGDDMGIGKTVQSIGWLALRREKALPALVACPASLKINWVQEIEKFTDFRSLILAGTSSLKQLRRLGFQTSVAPEPGYDVTIVNYDLMSVETPKTWVKQLLAVPDISEVRAAVRAGHEKSCPAAPSGPDEDCECQFPKFRDALAKVDYAEKELVSSGYQAEDILVRKMEKTKEIEFRNRLWKVISVIRGDENARAKRAPEYMRIFVNGIPVEEFMGAGFRTVISDEAHALMNIEAQRTVAMLRITEIAPHSIVLTGTPIQNRPMDLWTQTQLVDRNLFPRRFDYGRQFCAGFQQPVSKDKTVWNFSGNSNLDVLEKTLRSTVLLRRLKSQVLTELPEKTIITIPFVIEPAAERKYQKETKPIVERLAKARKDRDEWRAKLEGMAKKEREEYISKHAEQAVKGARLSRIAVKDIEEIKKNAVDAKLDACIDFILDAQRQQGKILVFATHHATIDRMVEAITKEGIRVGTIDGRVNQGSRKLVKDAFQDGDLQVLICGIRAASEGLTLTAAHTVIFVELDWNPGRHFQAMDRVYRIGQKNAVTVYFLIALGTIEEKLARMIDAKMEVVNAAMGEGNRTLNEDGIIDSLLMELLV
jgi:SNF2 family DNA or RNA helicase